jgi:acylphosphatase
MQSEVHCVVTGKVQRVGYRDFVTRAAKLRALCGFVRNHDDGTVEVLAQGTPDDLKAFVEELNEGSVLAKVESVAVDWRTAAQPFDDFEVLF